MRGRWRVRKSFNLRTKTKGPTEGSFSFVLFEEDRWMVDSPYGDRMSMEVRHRQAAAAEAERRRHIECVIYSKGFRACRLVEDWERWRWCDIERDLNSRIVNVRNERDCSADEIVDLSRLLHTSVIVMRAAGVGVLSGWALASID